MTSALPQQDKITKIFEAVYSSFALQASLELDIYSILEETPKSTEEIAREIDVYQHKLQPLLFALVSAGLLKYAGDKFSNTPESNHFLVKGKPDYVGGRTGLRAGNWKRMLEMSSIIRNGKPAVPYDDPSVPDEQIKVFRGLYPGAVQDANYLLNNFTFSQYKSLLDIGGGAGGVAITLAQANPLLKTTVLDLPSVTPITTQFIKEANASDQVDLISANAIQDKLSGSYNVVVARHLIQVLSKEEAPILLKKIIDILEPDGVLYIIGYVLENSRLSPLQAVNFNLILMTGNEYGEAYTEDEYAEWIEKAGFINYQRTLMPYGASVLTVRKPS